MSYISKIIWTQRILGIAKAILWSKNNAGGITISDLGLC